MRCLIFALRWIWGNLRLRQQHIIGGVFVFIVLAGGLLIVIIAVIIAVVSSVVSAVAADSDESTD